MNPAGSLDSNESVVTVLVSVVGNYTLDALLDSEQRRQHKELCAERLAAQDNVEVQYAEQAVLANLDWGIDALEEAILTSNEETKRARLEHAERMLQVSALLNIHHTTAGVPNSYLSAWAHLNLAFVWKLRNDDHNAAAHMLEMFLVEPLYSRVDFAPSLWEHLFLPHLTSIVAWYTEQRHHILSSILPDGTDFSLSREDLSYNVSEYKNFLSTVSPEQAAQLQQLEQLYQDSLDENTRLYARYYKDWLNFDPAVTAKRSMPLMPIAEPPMTPMHELSHIPQSVKFGPQPPTSAGFSHSNFGFSTVYTNSSQQATMFGEHKGGQEDLYNRTHGNQSLIWEEDESGEPEYGAQGNTYNMDLQMTEKNIVLNKQSSGRSLFMQQQSQGNMYNPGDHPYGQKSDILKQQSPKERNASPAKAQNHVKQNSKLSRHHEGSHRRTGSSKPLLALFQDQDAVMASSPKSSPAVEEYPSPSESGLKVQFTI